MNIRRIDIFSPLIIIFVILAFLALAVVGIEFRMRGLKPVLSLTYVYIFFGILSFIIGFFIAKLIEKRISKNYDIKNNIRSFFDVISDNNHFTEKLMLIIVFLALLLQIVNLYFMNEIPLFSGLLKAKAFNSLTIISYIIFLPAINFLIAKFYRKRYFLIVFFGAILFAATGYRATTLAIVISILITTFYTNGRRFRYFLILTPIILILGLIIGYIACLSIEWQQWDVNPLSLVFIRAGYTLTVLDYIVRMQNPNPGLLTYYIITGFFKSVDPRLVLGQIVFQKDMSITATMFGPAVLELGFIGVGLQMFFLGIVLELLHFIQKIKDGLYTAFYSIGLSYTIVWVETSPADLAVWIYYLLAIVLILNCYLALKKGNKLLNNDKN
ncbi:oligosaccharide repeat unit polymerase family protein [Methanobacterium alcaliphilum]|uniref:oligosaccharide repeat unit polymerase family protein n=1 Tax=Methanobacterium alcaliphilum TaxID=392018 RepID=UPI00200AD5AF|nr:oligosaccharide repeat unit polymerase family protein [Methanobacterium alcaliphilum]MCK9152400.1 oligosaccharide repeat unit polymerase family protein [Methanobacterium alcaliphilum]